MKTYASDNNAWKQVNALLPKDFQMRDDFLPEEETWEWNGNVMHIDRYANPQSEYRIFLHHGVGTNGRQLMMIFGHKMAAIGYEVVAMDNLGYGMTEVKQKDVTYDNWVHAFADFVNAETRRDHKKPVLYGLSAGGMITYHASCYMDEVYGIIGMCFLEDSASGGASVQLQFLAEYMTYRMPIPAEDYDRCPILLTQPEQDRWTPLKLSQISMKGIKAPFTVKILSGGGHYPMEETALRQLVDNAKTFIGSL